MYELLCGRRAFDGRTVDETLDQVLAANPKPVDRIRPETPPTLVEIVRKAMAKEPAARYQKAAELRNALADFVDGSRAPAADAANERVRPSHVQPRSGAQAHIERPCDGGDATGSVAIIVLAARCVATANRRAREKPAPVTAARHTGPPVEPHRRRRYAQRGVRSAAAEQRRTPPIDRPPAPWRHRAMDGDFGAVPPWSVSVDGTDAACLRHDATVIAPACIDRDSAMALRLLVARARYVRDEPRLQLASSRGFS